MYIDGIQHAVNKKSKIRLQLFATFFARYLLLESYFKKSSNWWQNEKKPRTAYSIHKSLVKRFLEGEAVHAKIIDMTCF